MGAIIGAMAMFSNGFFEKLSFHNVNKIQYKNFLMFLLFINTCIGLFVVHIISGAGIFFDFLLDPIFFLVVALEIAAITLYKKNYEIHYNNFSNISLAIFSSVYMMPLVSYLYFLFIPTHENTVRVFYNSIYEALAISLVFFVLNVFYFYDKVKLKTIKKPALLLFLAFLMINVMFFTVFILQKYEGFLPHTTIFLILSMMYLLLALKNERKAIIENKNKIISWETLLVSQSWLFSAVLGKMGSKLIAVEFVAFLKRLGQIISGYIFDKFIHKEIVISKKDIITISVIATTMILVFVYYNFVV
ncbi:hypothetical protein [Candidatus Absconditicoccus praedator]|uniref:hypothetical protein n=1 Tax=Candidatus Absconditicoccus praedator TaxID=2735562 RepID=UPI001E2BA6DE|nr:hypothetical protein [Candidatus Absconditicoccus praedator]UFX82951.1 hypothetical protein HLG78_02345 [Candidatus Absconditicoccus praedator]